ncbi:MAG: hypothetical protein J6W24_06095 [Prevotella sp.]|nr:hypothetical protein [Prevotella sp.]
MERQRYEQRMAELGDQYATARQSLCPLTAAARMRKMVRLYAEYTGKSITESEDYLNTIYKPFK